MASPSAWLTGRTHPSPSGTVHRDENPFRSTSRDHVPAFADCFAGVAASERYLAFSESLHAASPPQTMRSNPGQSHTGASPHHASMPVNLGEGFSIRSLSSSAADSGDHHVQAAPPRIERSPGEDTPARRSEAPATPILSPVGISRQQQQRQQHTHSQYQPRQATPELAYDRTDAPLPMADAPPWGVDVGADNAFDRLAADISQRIVAALLRDGVAQSAHRKATDGQSFDSLHGFRSSASGYYDDDDGDFTYYRPRYLRQVDRSLRTLTWDPAL